MVQLVKQLSDKVGAVKNKLVPRRLNSNESSVEVMPEPLPSAYMGEISFEPEPEVRQSTKQKVTHTLSKTFSNVKTTSVRTAKGIKIHAQEGSSRMQYKLRGNSKKYREAEELVF